MENVKELEKSTERVLGRTEVTLGEHKYIVSTVCIDEASYGVFDRLVIRMAAFFGGYATSNYETMVFEPKSDRPYADLFAKKYKSEKAALKGHKSVVKRLAKSGLRLAVDRDQVYEA